jgi:protoporphyrinogen/coproporphyrinogen III oxidase
LPKSQVLIVGGGIAGLTTAYDLSRRGVPLRLVEEQTRLGGLIWTIERDGLLMDAGPDAFLAAKPDARRLCEELGLGPELVGTNPDKKRVYVLHRGRLHPMPEGMRLTVPTRFAPLMSSPLFSFPGKIRMLLERFLPPRAASADEDESIAAFVKRRFGAEALARVGEPLLAGIHCGDAERLSMTALFPRLVSLEKKHGSVTRGMIAVSPAGAAETTESVFLSLEGGMGRLVDRLSEEIPSSSFLLGERVVELERIDDGYRALLTSGESIEAGAVVLALPIRGSQALLAHAAPAVADSLSRIATVSTVVVFHAFSRDQVRHPLDGYGFVVPRSEPNRLLAATFVSTKFPGRSPDSHVLLRAFLGGMRDPDVVEKSDEELRALSLAELERALGPLGAPSSSRVVRWIDRTPQVEVGHASRLAALERALDAHPGLFVLGSGLRGVGIPDSIAAARELVPRIAARLDPETG